MVVLKNSRKHKLKVSELDILHPRHKYSIQLRVNYMSNVFNTPEPRSITPLLSGW